MICLPYLCGKIDKGLWHTNIITTTTQSAITTAVNIITTMNMAAFIGS